MTDQRVHWRGRPHRALPRIVVPTHAPEADVPRLSSAAAQELLRTPLDNTFLKERCKQDRFPSIWNGKQLEYKAVGPGGLDGHASSSLGATNATVQQLSTSMTPLSADGGEESFYSSSQSTRPFSWEEYSSEFTTEEVSSVRAAPADLADAQRGVSLDDQCDGSGREAPQRLKGRVKARTLLRCCHSREGEKSSTTLQAPRYKQSNEKQREGKAHESNRKELREAYVIDVPSSVSRPRWNTTDDLYTDSRLGPARNTAGRRKPIPSFEGYDRRVYGGKNASHRNQDRHLGLDLADLHRRLDALEEKTEKSYVTSAMPQDRLSDERKGSSFRVHNDQDQQRKRERRVSTDTSYTDSAESDLLRRIHQSIQQRGFVDIFASIAPDKPVQSYRGSSLGFATHDSSKPSKGGINTGGFQPEAMEPQWLVELNEWVRKRDKRKGRAQEGTPTYWSGLESDWKLLESPKSMSPHDEDALVALRTPVANRPEQVIRQGPERNMVFRSRPIGRNPRRSIAGVFAQATASQNIPEPSPVANSGHRTEKGPPPTTNEGLGYRPTQIGQSKAREATLLKQKLPMKATRPRRHPKEEEPQQLNKIELWNRLTLLKEAREREQLLQRRDEMGWGV